MEIENLLGLLCNLRRARPPLISHPAARNTALISRRISISLFLSLHFNHRA
jgi:hypothetical protein